MKIAMANDHAGTALKNQIKEWLEAQGHEVVDFGTYDEEGCDLSDFVYPAAHWPCPRVSASAASLWMAWGMAAR